MTTEKVEGTDNSVTETSAAPAEMNLEAYAADQGEQAPAAPSVEAAPAEVDEWLAPPSALKPEYKAEWAKLPKNWRGEFYRRESDFHKGIEPYKTGHSSYEKLQKEILAPFQSRIQASGLPQEQYIKEFLMLDHVLASGTPQQKAQAVAAFAKHYSIDLTQYGKPEAQQQMDPTVRALQDKLAHLEGTLTQRQTAEQQREQQEAASAIEAFKADPKHLYFEDVKDDMAALLGAGRAKDLADAYDKACRVHPTVHQAIAKQQREDEEKKRIEDAKRKTADAKRAGFEVQSQGAAHAGARTKSLREELTERLG